MKLIKIFLFLVCTAAAWAQFDHNYVLYDTLLGRYACKEGIEYDKMITDTLVLIIKKNFENIPLSEYNVWEVKKRLPFFINLYNFYTLIMVLENYQQITTSIKDIKEDLLERQFIPIPYLGSKVSLNYLHHQIIRRKFEDPRVHFALMVGAAVSAPSLYEHPFTWEKIDWQLDTVTVRFLTDKDLKKNRYDGNKVFLSKMFEWYGGDFKRKFGGHQKYVSDLLGLKSHYIFDYMEYDWTLNKIQRCR